MDYGAPFAGEPADVALTRLFLTAGLPVARILEVFPEPGCLFVEDLGPDTLEDVLAKHPPKFDGDADPDPVRRSLYDRAVELALWVAERGTPVLAASERAAGPALDFDRFNFEMEFFVTHFVREYLGAGDSDSIEVLRQRLELLASSAADPAHRVLCHRDYHSRNLIVRPGGTLAMVDIQDARWGPDTYDLASLVYDAYVDLSPQFAENLVSAFLRGRRNPPGEPDFRARLEVVAAQRMIKALGTFGYQVATLGRQRYREGIPRTIRRLERLLPEFEVGRGIDAEFRRLGIYGTTATL